MKSKIPMAALTFSCAMALATLFVSINHAAEPATSYAVLQTSFVPAPLPPALPVPPKGLATFGGPLAATTLNLSNSPQPVVDAPALKMLQQLGVHYTTPNGLATQGSLTANGLPKWRGMLLIRGSNVPGMPLAPIFNAIPQSETINQPQSFTALDGLPQINLQTIGESAPAK